MGHCNKHDDQMTEWIMCLKAAKEVWDAAFLKEDRYEVGVLPKVIFALATEIHDERAAMRYSVVHKESAPEYRTEKEIGQIVLNAHNIAHPGYGELINHGETDG